MKWRAQIRIVHGNLATDRQFKEIAYPEGDGEFDRLGDMIYEHPRGIESAAYKGSWFFVEVDSEEVASLD